MGLSQGRRQYVYNIVRTEGKTCLECGSKEFEVGDVECRYWNTQTNLVGIQCVECGYKWWKVVEGPIPEEPSFVV